MYFFFTISRSEARRPTAVSVCIVIVERLADGVLGMKHGVAAFDVQFLECYYNIILLLLVAVDHTLVWSMEF